MSNGTFNSQLLIKGEGSEISYCVDASKRRKISGWVTDQVCIHRQLLHSPRWDRLGPRQHWHAAYLTQSTNTLAENNLPKESRHCVCSPHRVCHIVPAASELEMHEPLRYLSERACCHVSFIFGDSPRPHAAVRTVQTVRTQWEDFEYIKFIWSKYMNSSFRVRWPSK